MGMMEATRTCLRKYFVFSGRAPRPEYWYFVLFCLLANLFTGILDGMVFGTRDQGPLNAIFSLATFIPLLSAGWRRMHDSGRSGLYLFYPIIALVGIGTYASLLSGVDRILGPEATMVGAVIMILAMIVLVVSPLIVIWWLTRPTQKGPNTYGPQPAQTVTRPG